MMGFKQFNEAQTSREQMTGGKGFWVSAQGDVYDIGDDLHDEWAKQKGSTEDQLIRNGWVRINGSSINIDPGALESSKTLDTAVYTAFNNGSPVMVGVKSMFMLLTKDEMGAFLESPKSYFNRNKMGLMDALSKRLQMGQK